MNRRKFRRMGMRGGKGASRSERVFLALMRGVCVDCGAEMVPSTDEEMQEEGEVCVECPECGWKAITGMSGGLC